MQRKKPIHSRCESQMPVKNPCECQFVRSDSSRNFGHSIGLGCVMNPICQPVSSEWGLAPNKSFYCGILVDSMKKKRLVKIASLRI